MPRPAGGGAPWEWVRQALRQRITGGVWAPGAVLPSRRELAADLRCSPMTIQKAVDALVVDGFVTTSPRRGSRVALRPPHRHRIAQVFVGPPPGEDGAGAFTLALAAAADVVSAAGGPAFIRRGHLGLGDDAALVAGLRGDLAQERLAGVFIHASAKRVGATLDRLADLPVVATAGHDSRRDDLPLVVIDMLRLYRAAFDRIHALGCRRPAVLSLARDETPWRALIAGVAGEAGCRLADHHHLMLDERIPDNHAAAARVLLGQGGRQAPDALLILDDNLVPGASRGVPVTCGQPVVPVVAHANFPRPTPCAVAAWRFGPDCRVVIEAMLRLLDHRRAGRIRRQEVPPCWQGPRGQDDGG